MIDDNVCDHCRTGYACLDCFGTGEDPDMDFVTCMSCGGTGEEPPAWDSCDYWNLAACPNCPLPRPPKDEGHDERKEPCRR